MTDRRTIGFIGLGIMGRPMAINLLNAGYDMVVCDKRPEPVQDLLARGARSERLPRDVASLSDVVITMLPDSPEVEQVVAGPCGILEGARSGLILVDMSSIDPTVTRSLAALAAQKGVHMLDAPVSGGEPRAIDGTLSIMVGGSEEDFERVKDVLLCMGKDVHRIGETGSGNVAKLANQIMVAVNIAGVAEALTLAKKAGVSPGAVYQAVRNGLAGSNVLDAKAPLMLGRHYEPGFRIDLHAKDLRNALRLSDQVMAPVPLASLALQILQALRSDGKGGLDHGAIALFYERLCNAEIPD